jgi:ectoine hydroxylase-related dioxygenase (phytanoyl-CoA dioxygenase family)
MSASQEKIMTISELAGEVVANGYTVWNGFLDHQQVDAVREAATALLASEHARPYPKSTRAWDLHLRGEPYVGVLTDPRLAALLDILLGERHLLSDFSLNQVEPGRPIDDWHIDYPYNEMPALVSGSILGLQCVLALDPFDHDNGATQLLPGTHAEPKRPSKPYDTPVTFKGEPGTLLVMAAATWHRSGLNQSDSPRTAVLMSFVERWIKPMSAPTDGLTEPIAPRLADLLGQGAVEETINGVPI